MGRLSRIVYIAVASTGGFLVECEALPLLGCGRVDVSWAVGHVAAETVSGL